MSLILYQLTFNDNILSPNINTANISSYMVASLLKNSETLKNENITYFLLIQINDIITVSLT